MKAERVPLQFSHFEQIGEPDTPANRALLTGFGGAECFALLIDGEPVVIGGVTIIRPGVGLLWSKQSERVSKSAFILRRLHESVKKVFPIVAEEMKLDRIEAHARADNPKACHWLEYFGFELEAPRMRNFAEGEDYALYAHVR